MDIKRKRVPSCVPCAKKKRRCSKGTPCDPCSQASRTCVRNPKPRSSTPKAGKPIKSGKDDGLGTADASTPTEAKSMTDHPPEADAMATSGPSSNRRFPYYGWSLMQIPGCTSIIPPGCGCFMMRAIGALIASPGDNRTFDLSRIEPRLGHISTLFAEPKGFVFTDKTTEDSLIICLLSCALGARVDGATLPSSCETHNGDDRIDPWLMSQVYSDAAYALLGRARRGYVAGDLLEELHGQLRDDDGRRMTVATQSEGHGPAQLRPSGNGKNV